VSPSAIRRAGDGPATPAARGRPAGHGGRRRPRPRRHHRRRHVHRRHRRQASRPRGGSALIGCGTYAESTLGGVLVHGRGRGHSIRVGAGAAEPGDLKAVDDPAHACEVALSVLVDEGRGHGGLIVVDWKGRTAWRTPHPSCRSGSSQPSRRQVSLHRDTSRAATTLADIRARGRDSAAPSPPRVRLSETLSARTGSRVFVQVGNLQMTAPQGARRRQPPAPALAAERRRGVVAASGRAKPRWPWPGNANPVGSAAVVVMPEYALGKVMSARRQGAKVIHPRRELRSRPMPAPRRSSRARISSSSIVRRPSRHRRPGHHRPRAAGAGGRARCRSWSRWARRTHRRQSPSP